MRIRAVSVAIIAIAALVVGGCSVQSASAPATNNGYSDIDRQNMHMGHISGDDDTLFKFDRSGNSDGGGAGLGVNAYLWRGALETLSFMPLASADPFGGVIITDWYQPPNDPNERFKATAYILGRQLRADGVRVQIYRQVLQGGQWTDASVSATTTTDIENKVLQRARELRTQTAGS